MAATARLPQRRLRAGALGDQQEEERQHEEHTRGHERVGHPARHADETDGGERRGQPRHFGSSTRALPGDRRQPAGAANAPRISTASGTASPMTKDIDQ